MKNLCWLRRDLRLFDHAALSEALAEAETYLLFIFDEHILHHLKNKNDQRVSFIYQSLQELEKALQKKGSSLLIRHGKPEDIIPQVVKELQISKVFINRDYEPYAKKRDALVENRLSKMGIALNFYKDVVIYEKHEVLTGEQGFFKVFTPYKNKWLQRLESFERNLPDYKCNLKNLAPISNPENILEFDWYKVIGFKEATPSLPAGRAAALKRLKKFREKIDHYHEDRNFVDKEGTSLLSVYLRFGNISVREAVKTALENKNEGPRVWLSEIIWRDFYQMILDAHPFVEKMAFKKEYQQLKYPGGEKEFQAWTAGRTGFPIIDAAMRCLNATGMMHNRLRMITASFLSKTLLVDWRKGEAYFAQKLLDYDLAANNGGWQWAASTGCDAQPYFRIFNPYSQSTKFDPAQTFIRSWVPEFEDDDYPAPIVNYKINRERALMLYAKN
jgi:deoxyribodipyrimidine photo-lyase